MKKGMKRWPTALSFLLRETFLFAVLIMTILFASVIRAQGVPDSVARMHIDRGLANMVEGRLEFAKNEFEFVLLHVENPDLKSVAYLNTGVISFLEGNPNLAIKYYQSAIQLSPDYAKAYFNLGASYYKIGELRKAEEAFLEAIRLQPNDGRAHYSLGMVYFDQKKYNLAWEHAEKAEEYGVPYKSLKQKLAKISGR
jgi:tetratricopeptide (TPR) repeat protein